MELDFGVALTPQQDEDNNRMGTMAGQGPHQDGIHNRMRTTTGWGPQQDTDNNDDNDDHQDHHSPGTGTTTGQGQP